MLRERSSLRSNAAHLTVDNSTHQMNSHIVTKPPGWAYIEGIDEVYELKKRVSRTFSSARSSVRRVVLGERKKEELELERQRKRFSSSMFEVSDAWQRRDTELLDRLASREKQGTGAKTVNFPAARNMEKDVEEKQLESPQEHVEPVIEQVRVQDPAPALEGLENGR